MAFNDAWQPSACVFKGKQLAIQIVALLFELHYNSQKEELLNIV